MGNVQAQPNVDITFYVRDQMFEAHGVDGVAALAAKYPEMDRTTLLARPISKCVYTRELEGLADYLRAVMKDFPRSEIIVQKGEITGRTTMGSLPLATLDDVVSHFSVHNIFKMMVMDNTLLFALNPSPDKRGETRDG